MLQVIEFMSEAQKKLGSESDAEKNTQQKMQKDMEKAYQNFASAFGEAGPYLLKLKEKVEANAVGIVKDPATSLRQIANTIFGLTDNNETKREEARSTIDAMPTSQQTEVSAEEVTKMTKTVAELGKMYKIESESKAWDLLRSTVPLTGKPADVAGPESNSTASDSPQSLLQTEVDTEWQRNKLYGFLRNIIIFGLILVLAFVILGGLIGNLHWIFTGPLIVVFAIVTIEQALEFLGLSGGGGGGGKKRGGRGR